MKCKIFVAWFNTPSSLNKVKQVMEEEINLFLSNLISLERVSQTVSNNTLITTIFYKNDNKFD